jgi:hypothetical protein
MSGVYTKRDGTYLWVAWPPQRIPIDLDVQAGLYRSQLAGNEC